MAERYKLAHTFLLSKASAPVQRAVAEIRDNPNLAMIRNRDVDDFVLAVITLAESNEEIPMTSKEDEALPVIANPS